MVGKTISHYQVTAKLGEGGMGIVYKAQDTRLDRPVALKFLPPQFSDHPDYLQRFLREAKAASALNHPNILTIYDFEQTSDGCFIAMEFADGETLKAKLQRLPLAPNDAISIGLQVAEGLVAAHGKEIVHRDVKPENVMVLPDGRVKVMDFGLAQLMQPGMELTRPGSVVGTASYMSPEQVEGQPVDHRSDIFSLGVLFYEMLTGALPFTAEYEMATLYAIVHNEPEPLLQLNPGIPHDLAAIVTRCLKKKREERYQSCRELIVDLKGIHPGIAAPGSAKFPSPDAVSLSESDEAFVGRDEHIQFLHARLEAARSGSGRTILIQGESGIGKSHLAERLLREAQRSGMRVLGGRCYYQEGAFPYQVFVSAIKGSFSSFDHRTLDMLNSKASMKGIDLAGRSKILNALFSLSTESVALLNKEQLWDTILLFLRLLSSDGGLVLVIDDLQWADKTTLGLFSFLARHAAGLPMLLVGIYRQTQSSTERELDVKGLLDALRQLRVERVAEQIELNRLDREETRAMARSLLDDRDVDDAIVAKVFEVSQGNPLFIHELISLLKSLHSMVLDGSTWRLSADAANTDSSVPGRVYDVVQQRIVQLGKEDREILDVASCDGNMFQSDTLAACLKLDRMTLLKRLQSLEADHHLIRHEKNKYRFDHPLIRQILYESIIDELREEYHRLIVESLLSRGQVDDDDASRIAHHLIASGQEQRSLEYLLRAAARALALYAVDDALTYYRKAGEISSRAPQKESRLQLDLEGGLGDALVSSGNANEALRHYNVALSLVRKAGDKHREIGELRKIASALRIVGDIPKAAACCEEALALSAQPDEKPERVECLNTFAFICAARGEYDRTIEISREALALAQSLGDQKHQSISLSNIGFAHWHRGEYRDAVDTLESALALQRSIGDTRGLATTLNYAGLAYHRLGEFERALRSHEESLTVKQRIADSPAIPGSINNIGDIWRDIGDLPRAIEFHTRALALAREQQNRGAECDNLRDLGADYFLSGDLAAAQKLLQEVLDVSKKHGYRWYETRGYITLADVFYRKGEMAAAMECAALGAANARALNAQELVIEALWAQAEVTSASSDGAAGIALLKEAVGIAESVGHRLYLWQMYADLARLSAHAVLDAEMKHAQERSRHLVEQILGTFTDSALRQSFYGSLRKRYPELIAS